MPTTDPITRPGRRALLAGLASAALLGLLPRPAAADAASQAQALVMAISADLTKLVNSGRSEAQLYRDFEGLLARYADMPAVAAATLGPAWRGASAGQRQAYVAAFQSYLARKYGRQFGEYRNASISVTGARDAGKAGVLVQTVVVRPGQENIAVDWQISDRSGRARAVNLIIEGVSLLANERAEVGAMLDAQGGSVDRLTAELRARS
ncbi:MAG: ABC transporter substrate-binding protein [Rhodobacteraceae bacterium]|uniref:MlaC/ttg2D family ABC transporter substrate-binding protein n=1 Tax=Amaricoccus sp. TaxID=1872485 RepID=UPI001DEBEEA3|nr:ABC transporter substrate-binding protein [Amaricoccus sp.]MCB1372083.1 ABC transporter substrate-binding protein [Paracoccaceae bacterium]MCB1374200.1 ABC transporter substrate-binding protein [Paracoccaceae bacterium]MCC0066508.1 ABC transporter substrate-binding protein [Rhodovulum sp.]HRW15528.1 ABC transporter substrate-binding protein [Amaricoccus sp.]